MPLVKPPAVTTAKTRPPSRKVQLQRLADGNPDERRGAARALASDPKALPSLGACITRETDPSVRSALFTSISEIGGPAAATLVAPLVDSADTAVRWLAIGTLKRLGPDAEAALDTLLNHPDADVRLLAIEVTRAWAPEQAAPRLLRIIEADQSANVCVAAVDVATEVGTTVLLEPLQSLRLRFAGQDFLAFAIDVAFDRISTTRPSAQMSSHCTSSNDR
jgi:HEAT repeat protein